MVALEPNKQRSTCCAVVLCEPGLCSLASVTLSLLEAGNGLMLVDNDVAAHTSASHHLAALGAITGTGVGLSTCRVGRASSSLVVS